MGDAYPELRTEEQRIREVIRIEEERFGETLEKGLVLLENATAKLKARKKTILSGDVAFRLYDTYGFPLDLTEDILRADEIVRRSSGLRKTHGRTTHPRPRCARNCQHGSKIQLDRPGLLSSATIGLDGESSVSGYLR